MRMGCAWDMVWDVIHRSRRRRCIRERRPTVRRLRERVRGRQSYQIVHRQPQPSSVLNQLLAVNLIKPRYPNIIPLRIHQPIPQLFIFTTHGLKHRFPTGVHTRHERPEPHPRFRGRTQTRVAPRPILILLLLLRQPQSRKFTRHPVDMRFRLCFKCIL